MTGFILATLIPACLLAGMLCQGVRQLAPKWGLVDRPGERKIHTQPIPLGGGVALWAAVTLPLLGVVILAWLLPTTLTTILPTDSQLAQLWATHLGGLQQQTFDLMFLLACGTGYMLLGLIDDQRGLSWQMRLGVQLAIAAVVVLWRGWQLTFFVDLTWLTATASILWIVGLVNSFNMLDNMNGLSAGVGTIAAGMLAIVLLTVPDSVTQAPQLFIAGTLLLLAGGLIGFLWHNFPRAQLFLGDAGSYFLGFMLAVLAMLATFAGAEMPRHAVLAPLCILAVPLYDTLTVLAIRLRAGKSPFTGDKNHLSHRMVELGLSPTQSVLTIWLLTLATGMPALVLHQVNMWGAATLVVTIACLLCVLAILEAAARRHRATAKGVGSRFREND
jgi:UDP-GlcNAc:undecaprenyl-phosphate GlcNAc-1-phosphate transferase